MAVLLIALGRRTRDRVDARLRTLGLTYRHLSALGHLARHPDLSYSELGRRVGVTAQSMHATLAQLEGDGAVDRVTGVGRGRTAQLRVTASGRELLRHGLEAVNEVDRELLATLPEQSRQHLTSTLLATFRDVTGGR